MKIEKICICGQCEKPPHGEQLLDMYNYAISHKTEIATFEVGSSQDGMDLAIARTAVAIKFARQPKVFQLRAMVEEWDIFRMIRELY